MRRLNFAAVWCPHNASPRATTLMAIHKHPTKVAAASLSAETRALDLRGVTAPHFAAAAVRHRHPHIAPAGSKRAQGTILHLCNAAGLTEGGRGGDLSGAVPGQSRLHPAPTPPS